MTNSLFYFYIIALILLCAVFLEKKGEAAFRNQIIIQNAIHRYHLNCIRNGTEEYCNVNYDDMEPYIDTVLRLCDWGYTRILSKEKYQIIKPYIKEGEGDE